MKIVLISLCWLVTGLLSAIIIILTTGIIPFIVPGMIVGVTGAAFEVVQRYLPIRFPWWLAAIVVTSLAMVITLLLIPDTRHWVIARMILPYYIAVSVLLKLVLFVFDSYKLGKTSEL